MNLNRLIYEANPKIGWWLDNDPIIFYYGVKLEDVVTHSGDLKGKVLELNLEPSTPTSDVMFILEIPTAWMMEHMVQQLSSHNADKLLNKDAYSKWKRFDFQYYHGTHIHIVHSVPYRYIRGFIIRG